MQPTKRRKAAGRVDQLGFTLIEAVVVMVVMGAIAGMIASLVSKPITAYLDQARRASLSDASATSTRRIGIELASALPNSVRVDATGTYLEFIPVSAIGRFRAATTATGTGDVLNINDVSDASFDILGPPITINKTDYLVIYNLGLPGADAYAGDTRRALSSNGTAITNIAYSVAGSQFPAASPSNRFHVVQTPITYVCTPGAGGTGTIRRYSGYYFSATQPTSLAALAGATSNALLVDKVSSCSFTYTDGAMARMGLVTTRLKLTAGGETVSLVSQAHVENTP